MEKFPADVVLIPSRGSGKGDWRRGPETGFFYENIWL
jgi:hypothetical protein